MNTVADDFVAEQAVLVAEEQASTKDIKCVIWDLDNTLWSGILAEGDEVVLKPGVREILKTLDSRGILNSIASKNNEGDALDRLKRFGIDHLFLYPQISWNAKSVGVGRIQQDLNIGMDTLLFIDDQPFERDEVAAGHPSVTCVDAEDYVHLLGKPRLTPKVITEDASRRRLMYLEDGQRKRDEDEYSGTPEAFLATLDMEFTISSAKGADLHRAEELTLRTNQLNSTGITYGMAQLESYLASDTHRLLICELTDRYGSYGKIGLALIEESAEFDHIRLLLMSCRTVSRGVGSVLLTYLMKHAAQRGKGLRADFRRTERNRQMLVTYQFSRFKQVDKGDDGRMLFENDLNEIPDYPPYIDVRIEGIRK